MMADKKIAVHVTNEKQWNEVSDYYTDDILSYKAIKLNYPNDEFAIDSEGLWSPIKFYKSDCPEYEIIEFSEWKERVRGDNMEKIEVPQAVYDEFMGFFTDGTGYYLTRIVNEDRANFLNLYNYLFENEEIQVNKINQLNIFKVKAGEAEFVPIEEDYYWQDKQESWLGYVDNGSIAIFVNKNMADKITESEIREKTSFNINKLKKVSE